MARQDEGNGIRPPDTGEYLSTAKRVTTKRYVSESVTSIAWVPLVQRVTWDSQGLELECEKGPAKRYTWEQVTSLKEKDLARDLFGLVVRTSDGGMFGIPDSGTSYEGLAAALRVHFQPPIR